MSYADELADYVSRAHSNSVISLGRGAPVTSSQLRAALAYRPDGEVFIEVDRNFIEDLKSGEENWDLLPHLWPVAIRFDDEGDVIIHVTDGDRAQQ